MRQGLLLAIGAAGGFFLTWAVSKWQSENPLFQGAYPIAVRFSRWGGIIAGAAVIALMLKGLSGSRGDPFLLIGAPFVAAALGLVVCGLSRPLFYLGTAAYLHFVKEANK